MAPFSANVWEVRVEAGQAVKKGDVLLVLEAMKMESPVVAPVDGTVVAVRAKPSQLTSTGALLAVIATAAGPDSGSEVEEVEEEAEVESTSGLSSEGRTGSSSTASLAVPEGSQELGGSGQLQSAPSAKAGAVGGDLGAAPAVSAQ